MRAGAVRECVPDALVAIHLDTLNLSIYKDAMNGWKEIKWDYDVLGSSSYAFGLENMLGNVRKAGNYVASRGKLFAVLETSWLNSQKDADGTVNMAVILKMQFIKLSLGAVDMLSDL
ncbi:MAG: glycosyl hydrolase 53 family protein [Anaerobutyricum soehngenii]